MFGYIIPVLVALGDGSLLIYGVIHEQALIDFEDKVYLRICQAWSRKKHNKINAKDVEL